MGNICFKCKNKGKCRVGTLTDNWAIGSMPLIPSPIEVSEVYCDCDIGRQVAELENQFNHPEYENPLAKMTDQEILDYLDDTIKS